MAVPSTPFVTHPKRSPRQVASKPDRRSSKSRFSPVISAAAMLASTVVSRASAWGPITPRRDVSQTSWMMANGSWADRVTWLRIRIQ